MSLSLVFRRAAESEFRYAAEWYEAQRPELGVEFVSEVQNTLKAITANPLQHPIIDGDIRGALLNRFPYCIFFRIKPARVTIIAVFHTSRDPASWQMRK